MTREEYVQDIKYSLGAPTVDIATENTLGGQVDRAFREVRRFITETRYITVDYSSSGIDTKKLGINTVVQVFRTVNPAGIVDISDVYSLGTMNPSYAALSPNNTYLNNYVYRTQLTQLKSTMSTDMDFTVDHETKILYVNTFYPTPMKVTIVYIPEFKDVSDVTEQYWINLILRLAIGFAKEAEGYARRKYDLSSSLYKLDGASMAAEGIAERDAVRQELSENSDIAFPMD